MNFRMIHVTVLLESLYSEPGIYRYTYSYIYSYIYIYVYVYIEREIERYR